MIVWVCTTRMVMNYSHFYIEDFMQAPDFRRWATQPGLQDVQFWNAFCWQNPAKAATFAQARQLDRWMAYQPAQRNSCVIQWACQQQVLSAAASTSRRGTGQWLKIAAMALLLITSSWLCLYSMPAITPYPATQAITHHTLPNGATVTLNKNSTLYNRNQGWPRQLPLRGAACMEVLAGIRDISIGVPLYLTNADQVPLWMHPHRMAPTHHSHGRVPDNRSYLLPVPKGRKLNIYYAGSRLPGKHTLETGKLASVVVTPNPDLYGQVLVRPGVLPDGGHATAFISQQQQVVAQDIAPIQARIIPLIVSQPGVLRSGTTCARHIKPYGNQHKAPVLQQVNENNHIIEPNARIAQSLVN